MKEQIIEQIDTYLEGIDVEMQEALSNASMQKLETAVEDAMRAILTLSDVAGELGIQTKGVYVVDKALSKAGTALKKELLKTMKESAEVLTEAEVKIVYNDPKAKKKMLPLMKRHGYTIISGDKSTDSSVIIKTSKKKQEIIDDIGAGVHTYNGSPLK